MLDPPPDTPSSSSSSSCLRPAASQTAKEKLQIVQQRAQTKNYISQVIRVHLRGAGVNYSGLVQKFTEGN